MTATIAPATGQLSAIQKTVVAQSAITAVETATGDPQERVAILIVATVIAIRNLIRAKGITRKGDREKVLGAALLDFGSKLRQFVPTGGVNPPLSNPKM